MKRIINLYITREIVTLFLLGIMVFTLILLMGRLIKLTDLVISRGVPLVDVGRMILYLMPSFLVFTIPMAFLLAVLLAFGRLSSDNEITVMKAGGISLMQLMPPVVLCAMTAALLTLAASTIGVPWGNSAFKKLSFEVMKQNVSATIREKVFWDEIPGIVMYTEQYNEERHALSGVIIHDVRDRNRPLTIFAAEGSIGSAAGQHNFSMALKNGSIHLDGTAGEYRLIHFGEYLMTVGDPGQEGGFGRNEFDMSVAELRQQFNNPASPKTARLKAAAEYHSRFSFPFASLVFAVVAVPLGMQNRRSGKSAGYATSIGVLLTYYVVLSLLRSLAEKGTVPPMLALWLPNLIFLGLGWYLLRLASQERGPVIPGLAQLFIRKRKAV